ncbi:MAG: hypothetical protein OR994_06730 [Candidatus Poseidoniales archaeon]|nr:hypothetical protein [Candidatus Poseidoniales archaeon]
MNPLKLNLIRIQNPPFRTDSGFKQIRQDSFWFESPYSEQETSAKLASGEITMVHLSKIKKDNLFKMAMRLGLPVGLAPKVVIVNILTEHIGKLPNGTKQLC